MRNESLMMMDEYAQFVLDVPLFWLIPCWIFHFFIVNGASGYISSFSFPAYRTLSRADQEGWKSRGVSTYHAILVTGLCIVSIFKDELYVDKVHNTSKLLVVTIQFSMSYMIADTLNECRCHFLKVGYSVSSLNIVHHLVTIGSMLQYLFPSPSYLSYVTATILATEITTPIVNLRWCLLKTGYAGTIQETIVSFSMLFAWIAFRMTICCQLVWFDIFEAPSMKVLGVSRRMALHSICWVMLALNSFWLFLMLKKAFHLFLGRYRHRETIKEE